MFVLMKRLLTPVQQSFTLIGSQCVQADSSMTTQSQDASTLTVRDIVVES
uniref:Uncharacterized protein n=1 Tax=Anguilla anguilla TaxID=7936 RepID=A0A0E9U3S6_ANGAN